MNGRPASLVIDAVSSMLGRLEMRSRQRKRLQQPRVRQPPLLRSIWLIPYTVSVGAACDIMAALTECEEVLNTPPHRRVLVDAGANEVIRPYNHQWWIDMAHGVAPSKKVSMKLAGNVADYGYMTKYREVMMKSGARGDESDI